MTEIKQARLKRRRELAGKYTQAEVARAIGVSAITYRKLENNPEKLTVEQVNSIARYLGYEPSELYFFSKSGYENNQKKQNRRNKNEK